MSSGDSSQTRERAAPDDCWKICNAATARSSTPAPAIARRDTLAAVGATSSFLRFLRQTGNRNLARLLSNALTYFRASLTGKLFLQPSNAPPVPKLQNH